MRQFKIERGINGIAMANIVTIKGKKNELRIFIHPSAEFELIKEKMKELLAQGSFFSGASMRVKFVGREMSERELEEVKQIILDSGLTILDENIQWKRREKTTQKETEKEKEPDLTELIDDHEYSQVMAPDAQVIHRTVRAGIKVVSPYSLVILGDVNPGAEVISKGDIYVWGRLRGKAHAGAMGDRKARIIALRIETTHLAIADCRAKRWTIEDLERRETAKCEQAIIINSNGKDVIEIVPFLK